MQDDSTYFNPNLAMKFLIWVFGRGTLTLAHATYLSTYKPLGTCYSLFSINLLHTHTGDVSMDWLTIGVIVMTTWLLHNSELCKKPVFASNTYKKTTPRD